MTTSTSSAPLATASSAATTLARGESAPNGNEMTEHTLTSAPLQQVCGQRHEVREHADRGEVILAGLAAEPLDVGARWRRPQQRVIDGLGEFLGVHAGATSARRLSGLEPPRV